MSENSTLIKISTKAELKAITKRLDNLKGKAPSILKNSINAAARKARAQMIKDAQSRYSLKNKSTLKKESEGGPKLYTAKVSNLSAEIKSKGSMLDIMSFKTRKNTKTKAAKARVLSTGSLKELEVGGIKAFVSTFASGHTAVVQREGADRLPIKKLLSPAVPQMLGKEEIQDKVKKTTYAILHEEILKRIDQINAV